MRLTNCVFCGGNIKHRKEGKKFCGSNCRAYSHYVLRPEESDRNAAVDSMQVGRVKALDKFLELLQASGQVHS